MSGFMVRPEQLAVAACHADLSARALADVARVVSSVVVPTGRAASSEQCAFAMRQLSAGLSSLALEVERDAAAVRAAAAGYVAVDRRAVGP